MLSSKYEGGWTLLEVARAEEETAVIVTTVEMLVGMIAVVVVVVAGEVEVEVEEAEVDEVIEEEEERLSEVSAKKSNKCGNLQNR